MTTIHRDPEHIFDRLSLSDLVDTTDFAGTESVSAESWNAFRHAQIRWLDRLDDLQIVTMIRTRDAADSGARLTIDEFIEGQGFDLAELEAEIDAEDA